MVIVSSNNGFELHEDDDGVLLLPPRCAGTQLVEFICHGLYSNMNDLVALGGCVSMCVSLCSQHTITVLYPKKRERGCVYMDASGDEDEFHVWFYFSLVAGTHAINGHVWNFVAR